MCTIWIFEAVCNGTYKICFQLQIKKTCENCKNVRQGFSWRCNCSGIKWLNAWSNQIINTNQMEIRNKLKTRAISAHIQIDQFELIDRINSNNKKKYECYSSYQISIYYTVPYFVRLQRISSIGMLLKYCWIIHRFALICLQICFDLVSVCPFIWMCSPYQMQIKDGEKIDRVLSISMLYLGTDVFLLRA